MGYRYLEGLCPAEQDIVFDASCAPDFAIAHHLMSREFNKLLTVHFDTQLDSNTSSILEAVDSFSVDDYVIFQPTDFCHTVNVVLDDGMRLFLKRRKKNIPRQFWEMPRQYGVTRGDAMLPLLVRDWQESDMHNPEMHISFSQAESRMLILKILFEGMLIARDGLKLN